MNVKPDALSHQFSPDVLWCHCVSTRGVVDPLSNLCWLLPHLQLIGMIGSPLRQPTPADRCQIISSLPVVFIHLHISQLVFFCLSLFPRSPRIPAEKSISHCAVTDQHCTLESHQHLVVVNKPFSPCVCWWKRMIHPSGMIPDKVLSPNNSCYAHLYWTVSLLLWQIFSCLDK